MKLTKTVVALAVAASFAAVPMTASATTKLSGLVQIKIQGTDEDDDTTTPEREGDVNIAAGDVLFGITSEHTMSNGLTGYGSLRVDVDQLSNSANGGLDADGDKTKTAGSADSVYVGVKGGFGDLRFGEIPLAVEYGQLSNDIYDIGGEISGGVSYVGTFGPASIIANWSPSANNGVAGNNDDTIGFGAKFSYAGFTFGVGTENRTDLANTAFGVSFAYAGASIGIHAATKETGGPDDTDIFGVKVGYGIGPVSLGLTHMTQETGNAEEDTTRLDIVYDMGGDTELSSRINSFGGDADGSDWRIQLTKFF